MKPRIILPILCAALVVHSALAAEPNEDALIAILTSNASLQQKDAACAQLKRIGTASCVPVLAALLSDEQLSHSARYALESMPFPEAGSALLQALDKTSGPTRLGIITSLGNRRGPAALPALAKLLRNPEPDTSAAAAGAMGRIGGAEATRALQAALPASSGVTHDKIIDALLACANKALADGDRPAAFTTFQQLYHPKEKDHIRTAVYTGMIHAAGSKALSLVLAGIQGNDPAVQIAALQAARDIEDTSATKALADLLPKSNPALQWALIEVLAQRADPAATSALAQLAKALEQNADVGVRAPSSVDVTTRPLTQFAAPDGEVHGRASSSIRIAALTALGMVGDASVVPMLAAATVATDPDEQKAAQAALLQLRRGDVTQALLGQLASAKPDVQVQIVNALAGRGEKSTVPRLIELARTGEGSTQKAAFRSLGQIADVQHLPAIVQLVLDAKSDTARAEAEETLASLCQRFQKNRALDLTPILQALAQGNTDARAAVFNCCSLLTDPRIRAALRQASADPQPAVRSAVLRALCNSRDPELLPDLISLARQTAEVSVRAQAIRGAVRLATEEEDSKFTGQQKLKALKEVLAAATRVEDKYVILAGLANLPDPEALKLVLPMLDDAALQNEAAQAATQIAGAIRGAHGQLATTALKKVVAVTKDAARRAAAETILNQISAMSDFLTAWQVAGPYEENGKSFDSLFDTVFPPEKAGGQGASWRLLPAGTNPQQPYLLDLLKAMGGVQRVAYARTRIYSPTKQTARLELGSDDGVKVWINGKAVYAKNIARPIQVASDKVDVTLQEGWNTVLLKVTQNNMGWEFCARFVQPDGNRLPALKSDLNFD